MLHTRFPHHFDVDQWHLYVWDCCRYIHGYLELKGASYEEEWLKKLKVVCDKVVPEDRQNRRVSLDIVIPFRYIDPHTLGK